MASNNEKGPLPPTITIIESADRNDRKSSDKPRSCCICVPEQTGVAIIFSFYFLSGFLSSVASFISIGYSSGMVDKVLLVISGILYVLLSMSGAVGITLIRNDKAAMMRKLSMASWIVTGLLLIYNVVVYILEIASKGAAVQECQNAVNQDTDLDNNDIDCNKIINIILVKDALKLLFVEFFSLYFSYVISRFSRRMTRDSRRPITPYSVEQNGQTTPSYPVYATRPPTSLDWIPPPTYTVRASNNSPNTN